MDGSMLVITGDVSGSAKTGRAERVARRFEARRGKGGETG
jgi:hypothetical protein